ncbi:VWA domain-containing protein [Sulfurimonas sp. SAG-AH-194-L11]|nr:VWA domain-containing protein [Sulfurimonas sp. SAG-AH-194-L11]MDF1876732.1 VWA domain-containing protein [Sulfurimonas sp. SAG-AH-194-L11]
MYFSHPLFLLLLVLPLLAFFYSFRIKKEKLSSLFSTEVLKTISVNRHLQETPLKYRLFLLAIFLMTLALAQPVSRHSLSTHEKSLPLLIALDISKSMLKSDVYPTRLDLALSKIDTLMNSNAKLRVGLLLFATSAYEAHPLSEDKASLAFIAKSIEYSKIVQKSTNLFVAFEGAEQMLHNYKRKNVLILSDIQDIDSFTEEFSYAKDNNLSINIISITKEPLANPSHRYTYSSDDIDALLLRLQKVQREESSRDAQSTQTEQTELFYFPLLLVLLILLFIYGSDLELKSKSINIMIVSLILLSLSPDTKASVLDFYHISNAQNSFKEAHYRDALQAYKKLSQTSQTLYNIANTQYKLELYDRAIQNYMKSLNADDTFNAKVYYNVANSYVKLKQLHLAKKYYIKSLQLLDDKNARENLTQVKHILSNQKHKKLKSKEEKYKLPQRISLHAKRQQESLSSDYVVTLEHIVLSQEEQLLQALKKQKPIIFLRKLTTHRRSKNVLQD